MIVKDGYLARKTSGFRSPRKPAGRREVEVKRLYSDWWLVKYGSHNAGKISLCGDVTISLPAEMIGKRVRFRMEFL